MTARVGGVIVEVVHTYADNEPRVGGIAAEVLHTAEHEPRVGGIAAEALHTAEHEPRVGGILLEVLHTLGPGGAPPSHAVTGLGLLLDGTTGEYASTPDSAALDIVGDIDLRTLAKPTSITPATDETLLGKWVETGNQRSYRQTIKSTGALSLEWSVDGTAVLSETTAATITASHNGFRATRVASTGDVEFYTSADNGSTWDAFESETSTPSAIFAGTADLEVGSKNAGTAENFDGSIRAVEVRDGVGGPKRANPVFGDQAPGTVSFIDGPGVSWAVNGGAVIDGPTFVSTPWAAWTGATFDDKPVRYWSGAAWLPV